MITYQTMQKRLMSLALAMLILIECHFIHMWKRRTVVPMQIDNKKSSLRIALLLSTLLLFWVALETLLKNRVLRCTNKSMRTMSTLSFTISLLLLSPTVITAVSCYSPTFADAMKENATFFIAYHTIMLSIKLLIGITIVAIVSYPRIFSESTKHFVTCLDDPNGLRHNP